MSNQFVSKVTPIRPKQPSILSYFKPVQANDGTSIFQKSGAAPNIPIQKSIVSSESAPSKNSGISIAGSESSEGSGQPSDAENSVPKVSSNLLQVSDFQSQVKSPILPVAVPINRSVDPPINIKPSTIAEKEPQTKNIAGLSPFPCFKVSNDVEIASDLLFDCVAIHQFITNFAADVFDADMDHDFNLETFILSLVPESRTSVLIEEVLVDLLYHVLADDLPLIHLSTMSAMFSLFLSDEHPELARAFSTIEFSDISFGEKVSALKILVDSLLQLDVFSDHLKSQSKQQLELHANILKLKRESQSLVEEIDQLKCLMTRKAYKAVVAEFELDTHIDAIDEIVERELEHFEPEQDRRMSARQREADRKERGDLIRETHSGEISVMRSKLELFVDEFEGVNKELRNHQNRLKEITETAIPQKIAEEKVMLDKVRNTGMEIIGVDRFGRRIIFFEVLGVICAEPSEQSKELAHPGWEYVKSHADFSTFKQALCKHYGESKLQRRLDKYEARLNEGLKRSNEFIAALCVIDLTPKAEKPRYMNADIRNDAYEVFSDCQDNIQALAKHITLNSIDDAQLVSDKLVKFDSEEQEILLESLLTAADSREFTAMAKRWINCFQDDFFNPLDSCLMCSLIPVTVDGAAKDAWISQLTECNFATCVLAIQHFSSHLNRKVKKMNQLHGKPRANVEVNKASSEADRAEMEEEEPIPKDDGERITRSRRQTAKKGRTKQTTDRRSSRLQKNSFVSYVSSFVADEIDEREIRASKRRLAVVESSSECNDDQEDSDDKSQDTSESSNSGECRRSTRLRH